MKRRLLLSVCVVLVLCLLCGCADLTTLAGYDPDFTMPAPSIPVQTELADPATAAQRMQNAGCRDYLPAQPVALVPFDEMAYTRPDTQQLCADFDALTLLAASDGQTQDILTAYYAVYDDYCSFYTMDTLANIRYSIDTTDSYYKAEYDFCEGEGPEIEEKLEAFYKACAHSARKTELEQAYFGEGFLDDYMDFSRYTNEEYLALSQQEETLLGEYRAALEDTQVTYNGKTGDYMQLMQSATTYEEYYGIYETYYNTHNPVIADYYIRLVKLRKQLAAALDYESYAAYCYDLEYGRDYTHRQGTAYVESIRTQLVPLYLQLLSSEAYYNASESDAASQEQVLALMDGAVARLGGSAQEAYTFMKAYSLYDLTQSDDKAGMSFTTYLYTYEAPFLTVDATGTMNDLMTFAHEFGHFTDSYVSYQSEEDLETAETFSQSMEYLVTYYLDGLLSETQIDKLRDSKLMDALATFVSQAAFADFEDRVYALPDEALTVQKLNELYRQVTKDYGYYEEDFDFYYAQAWVDVTHFFEAPYYVISYCVSSDTALQICQLAQAQPEQALETYNTLLGREAGEGVQSVMQTAGLENPFDDGRMEEIAAFFRAQLDFS